MRAEQRKAHDRAVIEAGIRPRGNAMTTSTVRTQSALMHVVGLMATVATGGQRCREVLRMTRFAG